MIDGSPPPSATAFSMLLVLMTTAVLRQHDPRLTIAIWLYSIAFYSMDKLRIVMFGCEAVHGLVVMLKRVGGGGFKV